MEWLYPERPEHLYGIFKNKLVYDPSEWATVRALESPSEDIDRVGNDGVTFWASDDSGFVLSASIDRRSRGTCNSWLSMRLPGRNAWFHQLGAPDGFTNTASCGESGWSAGGLRFHRLQSGQSWRICFGGLLTTTTDGFTAATNDTSAPQMTATVFIRLSFRARTNPYDVAQTTDFSLVDQWGVVAGEIRVVHGADSQPRTVNIHGTHAVKLLSRGGGIDGLSERAEMFATNSRGNCIRLCRFVDATGAVKQAKYSIMPYGDICALSADIGGVLEQVSRCESGGFSASTKYATYDMRFRLLGVDRTRLDSDWSAMLEQRSFHFTCDGADDDFMAVVFRWKKQTSQRQALTRQSCHAVLDSIGAGLAGDCNVVTACVTRHHARCTDTSLVGGKFAALALLAREECEFEAPFRIPNAFAIATTAFDRHVKTHEAIGAAVAQLRRTAVSPSAGGAGVMERQCEAIVEMISASEIDADLTEDISRHHDSLIADVTASPFVAVRSSAVTEDGVDASAAGQLESFLGISGVDNVLRNVCKCWASLYAYRAVTYRRTHGLPIDTSMAVVIQTMVPSERAGVMFTANPSTGNYNEIIVNSNFGLGDTVVDGECDVDSFILAKGLNNCELVSSNVGTKTKLAVQTSDGYTALPNDRADELSLTENELVLLGKVAMEIEGFYGSPRDIEWAIQNSKVYVLQARPITGLDIETDDDIMQEFDSAADNDRVCFTTGNIQEVIPSAVTPLSLSNVAAAGDIALQNMFHLLGVVADRNRTSKILECYGNHLFFNLSFFSLSGDLRFAASKSDMVDLSIVGRIVTEKRPEDEEKYVGRVGSITRWGKFFHRVSYMFGVKPNIAKWEKLLDAGYAVPMCDTFARQIVQINNHLGKFYECCCDTLLGSSSSATWSTFLIMALAKGGAWDTEVYSKLTILLTSCGDVLSAEVPRTLHEMAALIARCDSAEAFVNWTAQQATDWLFSDAAGVAGDAFRKFLRRHGHRCLRESEFRETCWRDEPSKVVEPLQAILRSGILDKPPAPTTEQLSPHDALTAINFEGNWLSRRLMAGLIAKARDAVCNREWSKSILVRMASTCKSAYARCAKLMAEEGRIPDSDLLYFFSHEELLRLAKSPSPRLVRKASRRRQLFQLQSTMEYGEIYFGTPTPTASNETEYEAFSTSLELKGLPIGGGTIVGRCRVVLTLREASSIECGEILIVTCTDIGWTPYFSMISGVVTEMGGLISHGAVIAREYGLPCVAGCKGVTKLLKTADTIQLDGYAGVVRKIDPTIE